jgi:hypothetical protein
MKLGCGEYDGGCQTGGPNQNVDSDGLIIYTPSRGLALGHYQSDNIKLTDTNDYFANAWLDITRDGFFWRASTTSAAASTMWGPSSFTFTEPIHAPYFYGDGSNLTGLPSSYFNTTIGSFTVISDLEVRGNAQIANASPYLDIKTDPALAPGTAPTLNFHDNRDATPGSGYIQMAHVPGGTPYDAIALSVNGELATLKSTGAGQSVFTARSLNSTGPVTTGGTFFGTGSSIAGPSTATYFYGDASNLTHVNPSNIDAGRMYGPFTFDAANLAQINTDGSFTGTGLKCSNNTGATVTNGLVCQGTTGGTQVGLNFGGGFQLIYGIEAGGARTATLGQGAKLTIGDHSLGYNVPVIVKEDTRFLYPATFVASTTFSTDVGLESNVSSSGTYRTGSDVYANKFYRNGVELTGSSPVPDNVFSAATFSSGTAAAIMYPTMNIRLKRISVVRFGNIMGSTTVDTWSCGDPATSNYLQVTTPIGAAQGYMATATGAVDISSGTAVIIMGQSLDIPTSKASVTCEYSAN